MAERPQVTTELSRDLNLFHITMMGLGMMIGAGVFVGIGLSIQGAGTGGLLLTMALNGLIALFSAMSFAELSSAIPRAGGAYNFARIGFGRGPSFLAGWMEWLASSAAGGFYAVVFATFTVRYFNPLLQLGLEPRGAAEGIIIRLVAMLAAGLFVYINFRGSSETGKIGAVFTIGQMLFVLIIGAVGIAVAFFDPARLENFDPFIHPDGWWKLLGTMGVIYVAFEGFEVIAQAGDETINPRKNVPKAMLYSVMIVTLTYLAVAFASVVAIKGEGDVRVWMETNEMERIDFFRAAAARLLTPGVGGLLVTLAVVFSATSALNATIYSATRASYALGRDGMLMPVFAKIHPRRQTPYGALGFTSVIVLIVAGVMHYEDASATASIMFLLLFFVVNVCVIRIRRNLGDELEYGYLMPLFPLFPILAIVCQVALCGGILMESWVAWAIAVPWVLAGVVLYNVYSRSRAHASEHDIHVLEEIEAAEPGRQRVMVSVANPANALELVQATYRLCQTRQDPRVELLHMVPVPDQVPLSDAEQYAFTGREAILETMLYLAPQFPISTHLRYCRAPARGIVSAVREKKVNLLIMGWHGRRRHRLFRLGSTIDPVIERSPRDVVVMKNCGGNRKFKSVLVPLAGGPNGALALEIAAALADPDDGQVTAFTVRRHDQKFNLEAFVEQNQPRMAIPPQRVQTRTVAAGDVVEAILQEADSHDLVVLGCTRESALARIGHNPVPETVASRCEKPIVMTRSVTGVQSWLRRWI